MHSYYVEERPLHGKSPLSWDLAHHIYVRNVREKVIVVTDEPVILMAATRKQWFRLLRQVQRERSSTLNATRISELSNQIAWMQRMSFTGKVSEAPLEADVTFETANTFINLPVSYSTIYITCAVDEERFRELTSKLPKNGIVVTYS